MSQPRPPRLDAVAQARTALRTMELAIRRARYDRLDQFPGARAGMARSLKTPPRRTLQG